LYRDRFGQFEGREIGPFPHETLGFAGYLNAYGELMGKVVGVVKTRNFVELDGKKFLEIFS
jgi:hypothetical protein